MSAEAYRKASRLFKCPICDAAVGNDCIGTSGRPRVSVHRARGDLSSPRARYRGEWDSQISSYGEAHDGEYVVYTICDRAKDQFGYVGQTGHFSKRVRSHISNAFRGSNKKVAQWLNEILRRGGKVEFLILEHCESEEHSLAMESKWVGFLSSKGHILNNRWREHRKIITAMQAQNAN
jgi:hypothetical protein